MLFVGFGGTAKKKPGANAGQYRGKPEDQLTAGQNLKSLRVSAGATSSAARRDPLPSGSFSPAALRSHSDRVIDRLRD